MRKHPCLLLWFFLTGLLWSSLYGQNTGISFTAGMASFDMEDMKYFQEEILKEYPVEGKVISSFPPYSLLAVNLEKSPYPILRLGVGYAYSTTGAKSDYSDYSGSLSTVYNTTSHRFGFFTVANILKGGLLDVGVYGRVDANISRLKIVSSIQTYVYSNSATNKYKAISPNLSAGLEVLFHIRKIDLGWEGGYLVDFPGSLSNTDSGRELLDPLDSSRPITIDWSGWRTGIKVIRRFGS